MEEELGGGRLAHQVSSQRRLGVEYGEERMRSTNGVNSAFLLSTLLIMRSDFEENGRAGRARTRRKRRRRFK